MKPDPTIADLAMRLHNTGKQLRVDWTHPDYRAGMARNEGAFERVTLTFDDRPIRRLQIRRGPNDFLALTDMDGRPLPRQKASVYDSEAGDLATLTVTFYVDGQDIAHHGDAIMQEERATLADASRAYASLSDANKARFMAQHELTPKPFNAAMAMRHLEQVVVGWTKGLDVVGPIEQARTFLVEHMHVAEWQERKAMERRAMDRQAMQRQAGKDRF